VRGFQTATLGPRDINGDVLGGNRRIVGNIELLFPMPGNKDKSVRLSTFLDAGNVWGQDEKMRGVDIRVAVGVAVSWDSPVGPLKFSVAAPIKKRPEDKVERFQFQLGKIF
jgi:outer membrane protein insertion porin family